MVVYFDLLSFNLSAIIIINVILIQKGIFNVLYVINNFYNNNFQASLNLE